MLESAAGQCSVPDHPNSRTPRLIEILLIAGSTVEAGKGGNNPAIFSGVDMLVYRRNPLFTPLAIAQSEVVATMFPLNQVSILACVEGTFRAAQKCLEIPMYVASGLQVLGVAPEGV